MNRRSSNPWSGLTDRRVTYALKLLMCAVLAIFLGQYLIGFLASVRTFVYVVVGSIFFAYLIHPAVSRLQRRMPLWAAIVVVYAVIAGGLFALVWFVIPHVVTEAEMLVKQGPQIIGRFDSLVNDPHDPITSRMPGWMRDEVLRSPSDLAAWLRVHGLQSFGRVFLVLVGTFAAIATFVIIPLLTAYLLIDLDNLKRGLAMIVPEDRWNWMLGLLAELDGVVGGFIRGQLLVALTVGALIAIVLTILGVPFPVLLGLVAAIGDLVPYVGAIIAFLPAFLSALINHGLVNAMLVLVAFVAIFGLEGHFIAPNIVSKTVKLSPFVVMLALLIGGDLGGLFGVLIAIPITGILRVLALRVFTRQPENEPSP